MTKVRQSVKSKIMKNKVKMYASHQSEDSEGEVEFLEWKYRDGIFTDVNAESFR